MKEEIDTPLWIMIGIIIVITLFLAIIYISLRITLHRRNRNQKKNIQFYPCYLNIILSLSIAINNIIRTIPTVNSTLKCKVQAFILALFDKLIGTTITVNSYLTYKGLCDNYHYIEHIGTYFIITNSISLFIALAFSIIFVIRGTSHYMVCYIEGGPLKEIPDTVITSLLFSIYLFCTLKTILFLGKNIKESALENESNRTFSIHYYRMLISIILCSAFYIVSILIINDSLFVDDDYIDIAFVSLCFLIDLFFTLNRTVVKQTLSCCRKEIDDENNFDDDVNNLDDSNNINSGTFKSMNYVQY